MGIATYGNAIIVPHRREAFPRDTPARICNYLILKNNNFFSLFFSILGIFVFIIIWSHELFIFYTLIIMTLEKQVLSYKYGTTFA